jgi:hypothetical protein
MRADLRDEALGYDGTLNEAVRRLHAEQLRIRPNLVELMRGHHGGGVEVRMGLAQQHRHRGGGARDAGVAMDEHLDPAWPEPEAFGTYDAHHRITLRFHDIIEPTDGQMRRGPDGPGPAASSSRRWSARCRRGNG